MARSRDSLLTAARLLASRAGTALRDLGVPVPGRAKLVYHPDYVSERRDTGARHAFDGRRPRRIVDQLYKVGVLSPSQVITPEPATREDLLLVHTPEYLDELSRFGRLADLLFLPPEIVRDNPLLHNFLLQTGGTISAAVAALRDRVPVFNLGGGFHHAQRDRAEGFCAINDLAIAVRVLQQQELARDVLIIDLDYHQGNGTALVFSEDESVFTLSVHGQNWAKVAGKSNNLDVELPPGTADEEYLAALRQALEETLDRFTPQAALYVAGADPHEEDTLGDFAVTEDGLLDRDLYVWETLKEAGIPFAVTLGGGYSPLAWTIPYNFIFSALTGARLQPAHRPSNIRARYRRVKASLNVADLRLGDVELTEEDVTQELTGERRSRGGASHLFMGTYTAKGLEYVLERYGFLDLIRERGFSELILSINPSDPDRQIFRVHDREQDPEHLLVELVASFRNLVTPVEALGEGAGETYRVVCIEWLLMQDPRATFSLDRQKLPGQRYPGLGLGRWMVELLRMMSERVGCVGLMNIPQHYHNAYIYSKQMLCFDPVDQGFLEALKRDLGPLPLVETSLAIDDGFLRRKRRAEDGGEVLEPVAWEGKPQVMPVRPELNRYFARQAYIQGVSAAREEHRYVLAERRPS